jgi:hypothetical protein
MISSETLSQLESPQPPMPYVDYNVVLTEF